MIYCLIIAFCLGLDQLTKYLISANMALGETTGVIGRLLQFTYTINEGASFSILQGKVGFFIVITFIALAFVAYFFRRIPKEQRAFRIAVAVFVGGTLGNLIDRIFLSGVRDFINISFFPPVFNIADCCITLSVIFICFILLFTDTGLFKKPVVEGEEQVSEAVTGSSPFDNPRSPVVTALKPKEPDGTGEPSPLSLDPVDHTRDAKDCVPYEDEQDVEGEEKQA